MVAANTTATDELILEKQQKEALDKLSSELEQAKQDIEYLKRKGIGYDETTGQVEDIFTSRKVTTALLNSIQETVAKIEKNKDTQPVSRAEFDKLLGVVNALPTPVPQNPRSEEIDDMLKRIHSLEQDNRILKLENLRIQREIDEIKKAPVELADNYKLVGAAAYQASKLAGECMEVIHAWTPVLQAHADQIAKHAEQLDTMGSSMVVVQGPPPENPDANPLAAKIQQAQFDLLALMQWAKDLRAHIDEQNQQTHQDIVAMRDDVFKEIGAIDENLARLSAAITAQYSGNNSDVEPPIEGYVAQRVAELENPPVHGAALQGNAWPPHHSTLVPIAPVRVTRAQEKAKKLREEKAEKAKMALAARKGK